MYLLYVSHVSPYSMKAAATLSWAGVPYEIRTQTLLNRFGVIQRLTGATLVPVLREGDWAINDSTRIAEFAIEKSTRPLLPASGGRAALAWMIEDLADEWLIFQMAISRWCNDDDAEELAGVIGEELAYGIPIIEDLVGRAAVELIRREVPHRGIHDGNREAVYRSRERMLSTLEGLLGGEYDYLFGGHPTVADFAMWGMYSQHGRDLSGGRVLAAFPNIEAWIDRIDRMKPPFGRLPDEVDIRQRPLAQLRPIFAEFLGTYWRLLVVNHRVRSEKHIARDATVEMLDGTTFDFRPNGYLVGRLRFVLELIDTAYAERSELFGVEGLDLEAALLGGVERLTEYEAGRELLREYPHIGD